ncbi:MAG TPA: TonB-dependent receptor, partial [Vicinamibacterales bacterium]|nr:TonB-dependent receptor [Vicinamibacterales bacterium]
RDANVFSTGEPAADELQFGQGGFRLDSSDRGAARWTVQGDAYRGTEGLFDRDDTDIAGGNLLARWVRRYSGSSDFQVEAFYDRTTRTVPLQYEATQDTFDVDVQRRLQLAGRHDLVVGGDFRVTSGRDVGKSGFLFDPEQYTDKLFSLFAQDEVALTPRVFLTFGSKFERNDFTGFEIQPTMRGRWSPSERQTVWGALSRAVRLPTRFDTDLRILNPATGAVVLSGSPDFDAETVVAYEAGYRVRPHARVSIDAAVFTNRYDDLRSQELPAPGRPFTVLGNMLNAVTSGLETATTIQVLDTWRVHAWGAYLHKDLSLDPDSRDVTNGRDEGNDPSFHMALRSQLDLPAGFALDGAYRYVSARPFPAVSAYSELDLRLGWALRAGWDLSLVGHNLLHDHHPELGPNSPRRYEFERGVFLRSTWRF